MRLTGEQYDRLDELEDNPRCLFEGAAGTGKTLLALEYARRANTTRARVLFVCFNRLLGDWLKQQTNGTGITTGTWSETLKAMIVDSGLGDEFHTQEREALAGGDHSTLFQEIYPFYGEMALDEMGSPFDVLVMDEAQDLCRRPTLDLVNRAIRGGLAGGTWGIFGDFTRQAIYGGASDSILDLSEYSEHFVRARLTLNCRNTRRIAEETSIVGGFERPPFRFGHVAGQPVEHRYWRTASGMVKVLTRVVDDLTKSGVPVDDLMVLSPRRLENSALASVESIGQLPLVDCSRSLDAGRGCLRFSTIHSFKGLESKVAIIVDIDQMNDERSQSLLYVGMSRARGLLILMIHENVRSSIDTRIRESLERGIRK